LYTWPGVAWVKEMKTRIKIELPQFCPAKDEQIKIINYFFVNVKMEI